MITAVTGVAVILLSVAILFLRSSRAIKPPGPPADPFIGHVRSIPPKQSWVWYNSLRKTYGDAIHLSALGSRIVILNTWNAANELMGKRAAIYSDRPQFVMASEIMGLKKGVVLAPFGPNWREQRKLFATYLSKTATRKYESSIAQEMRSLVLRLIGGNVNCEPEIRLSVVRILISMAYGIKVNSLEDDLVQFTIKVNQLTAQSVEPGRFMVDVLPILQYLPDWFPGTGWKREGRESARLVHEMIDNPFQQVKRDQADGVAQPSFTADVLRGESSTLSEETQMWTSGVMYSAGADTIISSITKFVLALTMYPEVQRAAQEEIDNVIGTDRLPNFDDHANLPYLGAVYQELLRWKAIAPLGVPHRLMEDDEYEGSKIPAGSMIVSNLWAMSVDPEFYPDPEEFRPERFLASGSAETNHTQSVAPMDPRSYSFGFGRRVCPGVHFAELSIFTAMVSFLATTNILRAQDENGNEAPLSGAMNEEMVSSPQPFECRFVTRSLDALALARSDVSV